MNNLIITCEHASNLIPQEFNDIFVKSRDILNTHKGYDIGAQDVAVYLSAKLKVPLFKASYSRLLIDLNRSLNNRNLFSSLTKHLDKTIKKEIIRDYYLPYRNQVEEYLLNCKNSSILHISVHSFTPVLNKIERNCDIGFLYDPKRETERENALSWKKEIVGSGGKLRVRFNYPYKGISDGFTKYLRQKIGNNYSGIELEINQKLLLNSESITSISKIIYNILTVQ